ncbi:MAG: phospholipid carrier-dependent glycosyltransferase, partial [Candidatus Limnocylindrales bacterium]
QIHILGRAPTTRGAAADGWTVYVVEPHGNAVYADAALPPTMIPVGWAADIESQYPADDRQDLLVYGADGQTASIELGSHAFAWRLPGVIAGALTAGVLYLLARVLFGRRLVAGLVGAFVLLDGMLFVQSRIGMNDVYVGLFILAAYTLFAAVWMGRWRSRAAFWIAMPVIGILLGLALASKWVAAYAIGALLLLLLVRSALGRVLAIVGLIGITTVLGYLAISVPEGQGFGNLTFLLIMIGLTLLAVVVTILHPIAWSTEEMWIALIAPAAAGVVVFFGALGLGQLDSPIVLGSVTVTPLLLAIALAAASVVVYGSFQLASRFGFGPLAVAATRADAAARVRAGTAARAGDITLAEAANPLEAPAPPPAGWLRPGWLAGLPMVWALASLVLVPVVVYVASYVPWAMIENHQLWADVPAGHSGQTLIELTGQMYGYHNGLTAPHPASSPWWAWPLDLKPVWFYQDGFAGSTSAAVYDAGNLVIWWLGIPAMIFVSIMAYRRRSLALALIAIGFAGQWIPWARIDRAAFQYHYYTALPFVILALAYLVAELWHGASRRTWLVARIAAAVAILGPALMWLVSRPLCGLVGVESVNPGSQACPAVIPDIVLTARTLGLLAVLGVGGFVLVRGLMALSGGTGEAPAAVIRRLGLIAVAVAIGLAGVGLLADTQLLTLSSLPVEPIAVIVGLPLAFLAAQVLGARDARRYVLGLLLAVAGWFVLWYPNIAALPLPSTLVNAYQGFIPTYLYAFQFPVSTAERNVAAPLLSPTLFVLAIALTLTCVVVAYSAWLWRIALAGSATASSGDGSAAGPPSDGLRRSGGEA